MLVSEIATRVKRQFGDEAGAQVTDDDIIRWVNDAQIDIAVNNDLLQVVGTSNISNGVSSYDFPTDLLTLRAAKYLNYKLQSFSQEQLSALLPGFEASSETGVPTAFWVHERKINLYPTPSEDVTNGLSILYTKVPTTVTSVSDTPELPIQYHPRIVEYCIAQAAELDDNLNHYQLKMNQFKAGIDSMKDNTDWEERDEYPSITVSDRDALDSYGSAFY